jgi:hypothetical protein
MAARKKAVATRKTAGKDMVNVDAALKAEAAAIANTIGQPSSNVIRTTDKVFKLPDGQIIQNSLDVVIVDYTSKNLFYAKKYNPKNPEGPVCWSINKEIGAMKPSPTSPSIQCKTTCEACVLNEWGSDGEGKACKNTRALAVLLPTVGDGETLYTINVSPTGIKAFDGYINSINKLYEVVPIQMVTEIVFHPEKDWAFLLFQDPRPNEHYAKHFAFREQAKQMLEVEPQAGEVTKKAKPKTRGRR